MSFYLLLHYIWLDYYRMWEKKSVTVILWMLLVNRLVLCLFLQNGWLENNTDLAWRSSVIFPSSCLAL